jgi:hypothetical protein
MTAEIAVMNKLAVALAADSAVSLEDSSGGEPKKIYNTTNKLFMLSKYQPVGIMIYGNAELLRVPWEVIIKMYRERLGTSRFDQLGAYLSDFVAFLGSFFNESQQEAHMMGNVAGFYHQIVLQDILAQVRKITDAAGKVDDAQIPALVEETIGNHHEKLSRMKDLATLPDGLADTIVGKHGELFKQAIAEVFEQLPISPSGMRRLVEIGGLVCTKRIFSGGASGIVIAGFGALDIFPGLIAVNAEGVVGGHLKYDVSETTIIGKDTEAAILPFAQQEMVATFMEGVAPSYQQLVESFLQKVLEDYPRSILESMPETIWRDYDRTKVLEVLDQQAGAMLGKFKESLLQYKKEAYIDSIITTVGSLPKDELAAMAESLVNLTSFKLRVSMDAETVGGPIDVAVISKGDGFVWIKRKHYFRPDLNQQFFANYYRSKEEGTDEADSG